MTGRDPVEVAPGCGACRHDVAGHTDDGCPDCACALWPAAAVAALRPVGGAA